MSIVPPSDLRFKPVDPEMVSAPLVVKLDAPTASILTAPCRESISIAPESDFKFNPVDPDTVSAPLAVTLEDPTTSIERAPPASM